MRSKTLPKKEDDPKKEDSVVRKRAATKNCRKVGRSAAAERTNVRVDDLLPDRVVPAGVVVGGVLLAVDDLLGVVQVLVGAGTDWMLKRQREGHTTHGGGGETPGRPSKKSDTQKKVLLQQCPPHFDSTQHSPSSQTVGSRST